MSKGRLKKCHLPTTMSLSISYYNIEMVLFMLHALLLLFFFFFLVLVFKWSGKTKRVNVTRQSCGSFRYGGKAQVQRLNLRSSGSISTKFVLLISQIWMHETTRVSIVSWAIFALEIRTFKAFRCRHQLGTLN